MTPEEKEFCGQLLGRFARKWQVLNRSQWKYEFREKTLVRYLDEVQLRENEIQLVLEYLSSDDCVETLSLYDQTVSAEWKPVRAWLEVANKSVGAVHAVRLYHAMTTDLGATADGPYVTEDGCRWKVELTYHWRETSVPVCPQSTSGVHYSISGLQRSDDDGKYSYVVEKRTRVQQDLPEYAEEKTLYRDTKEESHFGVKEQDVAATGEQARFGGGVIVRRSLSKNEDCTTDVRNVTTTDTPVANAERTVHKTLRGTVVRVTSKNQPSAPSEDSLGVGDSVSSSRTPSGLYDVSRTTHSASPVGVISESCENTKSRHRHSTLENKSQREEAETAFTVGKVVSKRVYKTENGTFDVAKEETSAKPYVNEYEWTDDRGEHHVRKYRNWLTAQQPPSGANVKHVEDSINEFGLHDGVISWSYPPERWTILFPGGRLESRTRKQYMMSKDKRGRLWCRHRNMKRVMRCGSFSTYAQDKRLVDANAKDTSEITWISNVRPVGSNQYLWEIDVVAGQWTPWERHTKDHVHQTEEK